ncbi:hypothetical protein [Aerosakkonema funiforme]
MYGIICYAMIAQRFSFTPVKESIRFSTTPAKESIPWLIAKVRFNGLRN